MTCRSEKSCEAIGCSVRRLVFSLSQCDAFSEQEGQSSFLISHDMSV